MKIRSKHAETALAIQDACNLAAVVHEFSRVMKELMEDMYAEGEGMDALRIHPVVLLFVSKISDLCHAEGVQYDRYCDAYGECRGATEEAGE